MKINQIMTTFIFLTATLATYKLEAVVCSPTAETRVKLEEGIHPLSLHPESICTKLGTVTQYHRIEEYIYRGTDILCDDPFGPGEPQTAKVVDDEIFFAECVPGSVYGTYAVSQICDSRRKSGSTLRCYNPRCSQGSSYIQWFETVGYEPDWLENRTNCTWGQRRRLGLGDDGFPKKKNASLNTEATESLPVDPRQ